MPGSPILPEVGAVCLYHHNRCSQNKLWCLSSSSGNSYKDAARLIKLTTMDIRFKLSNLENKLAAPEALQRLSVARHWQQATWLLFSPSLRWPHSRRNGRRSPQEEAFHPRNKYKFQSMPTVKPMASKVHLPHIMDVSTINDYQQFIHRDIVSVSGRSQVSPAISRNCRDESRR